MTPGIRGFVRRPGSAVGRIWLPALAAVLSAASLRAGNITWTNAAGGDFQTPGNWNSNQVPGQSDVALFSITSDPYTVTWSQSVTNSSFSVVRGDLKFDLQGHTWGCTNGFSIGSFAAAAGAHVLITNFGLVEGAGWIAAKQFVNMGTVRPGGTNAAGTLTVRGSFTNTYAGSNGTIAIELGGPATNQYDRLIVTNNLYAGGTLSVSLSGGFKPASGNTFRILDYASVTGAFDTVTLPGGSARWDTQALYTTGEIRYLLPSGTIFVGR